MKTLIVYYSRSNKTEKVIDYLKSKIDCDVEKISTEVNYNGKLGFIKGVKDGRSGKIIPINPTKYEPSDYDNIIIAGPVWTSRMANPIVSYIDMNKSKLPDVSFIIVAKSNGFEESKKQLEELSGKTALKTLNIYQKEIDNDEYKGKIDEFI